MEVKISIKKVALVLFAIVTLLVLAHMLFQSIRYFTVHTYLFGIIDRFDVDNEQSIPTWFAQIELFMAAILLSVISISKRFSGDRFVLHWAGLAVIFCYLSMDEGATLHEMWIDPIKRVFHALPGFLGFAWVLPFALFVLVVFVGYLRFLRHLSAADRRGFLSAGLLFVGGAMGVEMIGAQILSSGFEHPYYLLSTLVEETLEMTGSALFIVTLLAYMNRQVQRFSVGVVE